MKSILFKILLSAILFNLAFFFPGYLGWAIIPSFIFLFQAKFLLVYSNFFKNFKIGFLWGLLVFSFHFIWLFELLLNKSAATFVLSMIIYLLIILYASFTSGLWFLGTRLIFSSFDTICKANHLGRAVTSKAAFLTIFFSTFSYFYFLQKYSAFFLGKVEGYPFLNPFIPLAKYKWFLCIYFFLIHGHFNFPNQKLKNTKIFYLKPVVKSFNQKSQNLSASVVGQKIYHQITELNLEKFESRYKNLIIVSPETAYPFSLNRNLQHLKLWNCVLPHKAHFLIGSQREEQGKIFQTVYWIHASRIIDFYNKKHQMPFTEKIFSFWKGFNWSKSLFLENKLQFQKGEGNLKKSIFQISEELYIIPKICSELFLDGSLGIKELLKDKKPVLIFFFVNDSWFIRYLKRIMENFVALKSAQIGLPIVYITHENCLLINLFYLFE